MKITGEEPADEAVFKSGLYFFKNEDYKKAVDAFKKVIKNILKANLSPLPPTGLASQIMQWAG